MAKSIEYGIRKPEGAGDFDRRPVVNNDGKEPTYDFGKRGSSKAVKQSTQSVTYFGGAASRGDANYAKQRKMQGHTGGQGKGANAFGKPKGSTSAFSSKGVGQAKQKKGFGGQTKTQYS